MTGTIRKRSTSLRSTGGARKPSRAGLVLRALVLLAPAAAHADHPVPGPHFLHCEARGNSVRLSWDMLGIAEGFHRALLHRDGALLVELAPEALSYDDPDVPRGRRAYRLDIVSAEAGHEGEVIASRECLVDVLLASGLRCDVLGGVGTPPRVVIAWDPLPDGRTPERFDVLRDGELAATLDAASVEHIEEPLPGEHLYTVVAIFAADPALEGSELIVGDCLARYEPPVVGGFIRADANGDENHDLSDPVFTLGFLFGGGPEPPCIESADTDDSGVVEITDAVYDLNFLFNGGTPPAAPFPACGHDATADDLGCAFYPACFTPPPP